MAFCYESQRRIQHHTHRRAARSATDLDRASQERMARQGRAPSCPPLCGESAKATDACVLRRAGPSATALTACAAASGAATFVGRRGLVVPGAGSVGCSSREAAGVAASSAAAGAPVGPYNGISNTPAPQLSVPSAGASARDPGVYYLSGQNKEQAELKVIVEGKVKLPPG